MIAKKGFFDNLQIIPDHYLNNTGAPVLKHPGRAHLPPAMYRRFCFLCFPTSSIQLQYYRFRLPTTLLTAVAQSIRYNYWLYDLYSLLSS